MCLNEPCMKTYLIGVDTRPSGFSLIEMLLVMALFSMSILVLTQTFASFNRLQRKLAHRSVLTQDARFATELMVRAVRNHPIAYAGNSLPPKSGELHLERPQDGETIVKSSAPGQEECNDAPTISCLLLSTDSGVTWVPLTGKSVHVEAFDVYLRPSESPFELIGGGFPNDVQPFVTLRLRLRYETNIFQERSVIEMQTTVASRVYLR